MRASIRSRERELRVRMQLQQAPQVQQRLAQARAQLARAPGFLPEAQRRTRHRWRSCSGWKPSSRRPARASAAARSPIARRCSETHPRALPARDACRCACAAARRSWPPCCMRWKAARHALFVDNLNVLGAARVLQSRRRVAHRGGLDVSFDLYGYLLPTATSAAARPAPTEVDTCALTVPVRAPGCWPRRPAGPCSRWLLALFGMGGRIAPLPADTALLRPLSALPKSAPERLGAAGAVRRDRPAARCSPTTVGRTRSRCNRQGDEQAKTFDYVLTSVHDHAGIQDGDHPDARRSAPRRCGSSSAKRHEALPNWRLQSLDAAQRRVRRPRGRTSAGTACLQRRRRRAAHGDAEAHAGSASRGATGPAAAPQRS